MRKRLVSFVMVVALIMSVFGIVASAETSAAKNALSAVMPAYKSYYARVTLDKNKTALSYLNFGAAIEDATALVLDESVAENSVYTAMKATLESNWQKMRSELKLNLALCSYIRGLYTNALVDEANLDPTAVSEFKAYYKAIPSSVYNFGTDAVCENTLSGFLAALDKLTTSEAPSSEQLATKEKLSAAVLEYGDILSLVTIPANKELTIVVALKQNLEKLNDMNNSSTYFNKNIVDSLIDTIALQWKQICGDLVLDVYNTQYCNNIISKIDSHLYTASSWNEFKPLIENVKAELASAKTDAECLSVRTNLKAAVDVLVETTAEDIQAYTSLKNAYKLFEAYAALITTSENKELPAYNEYKTLLETAKSYIDGDMYYSAVNYTTLYKNLNSTWARLRVAAGVAYGQYLNVVALLKTVEPFADSFTTESWNSLTALKKSVTAALPLAINTDVKCYADIEKLNNAIDSLTAAKPIIKLQSVKQTNGDIVVNVIIQGNAAILNGDICFNYDISEFAVKSVSSDLICEYNTSADGVVRAAFISNTALADNTTMFSVTLGCNDASAKVSSSTLSVTVNELINSSEQAVNPEYYVVSK